MTTPEIISVAAATVAMIGAVAAWGAIFMQRLSVVETIRSQVNIAARTSRATVVSANRQRWIDAIREDVAEFISVRARLLSLKSAGSGGVEGQDALLKEERDLRTKLVMLESRIDMRLNHTEGDHLALLAAIDSFDNSASEVDETELRRVSRKIFRDEWVRLKREASGIDPFVKEAVPPRK